MALSRRSKVILFLVAAPLCLVVALVVAVFIPAVQTYAARKALEGQGEVERVSVGMGGAELNGLKITQPGLVLSLPNLRADLPLWDLAGGRVDVRALVAKDVLIEIDSDALEAEQKKPKPPAEPKATQPFTGVLDLASLPPDLQVEGIDLAGLIRVAGKTPMEATFTLTGGGMKAGQTGLVELKVTAKSGLGAVETTFTLRPKQGADGKVDALGAVAEALATSKLLAEPARLRASIDIGREGAGETYGLRLAAGDAPLVELDTKWAPGGGDLPGRWKLAVRDADLAPFVLGLALPRFELAGAGDLTVSGTDKLRVSGEVKVAADALETVGLPALGPLKLATRFALLATAADVKVETFSLDIAGANPVLGVATRQAFTVALATKAITASRAGDDLAEVKLHGVPAEWIRLFVPELTLGGPVTGGWTMRAEGGGHALASSEPLVLTGVRYGEGGAALVDFSAVRIEELLVKQTGAGLEASVGRLRVMAGDEEVVTAKLSATRLADGGLTAKVDLNALLAKLADQPMLRGQTRLSAGKAGVELTARVAAGETKAQGQVRLTGLRAAGAGDLPEVTLDADVGQSAAGVLTFKLPVTVRNVAANRTSDLELSGTMTPGAEVKNVAAKLTSRTLQVADLQAFAAAAADTAKPEAAEPAAKPEGQAPASGPLWAGVTGELELSLARIVQAPGIEILDTKGRLALTREAATLDALQTLLGTGGAMDMKGALRWKETSGDYALAVDVKGRGVEVGPLLKSFNPLAAVPLEGTYDLTLTAAGEGADPAAAAGGAAVELALNGRKGLVRALNFETGKFAKLASPAAGAVMGLLGALGGDSGVGQAAGYASAALSVTRQLSNLPYDEIVLEAKRAADGSVEIGKVGLLSPQLRLAGAGGLKVVPGRTLMEFPLKLQLSLDAKGDISASLAKLNLLATPGADGFSPMKETLVLDGTLKQIGTSQVTRLLTRAVGL